jgi:TRAP-type uncharacterized transport system substrate-binding protein
MAYLPRGSNFVRAKMLWEIGLSVAGNPATPYGGDRDICIAVGNGSGTEFRPRLRMATGSPILAHSVAEGALEMAMINPAALLTQAYRGVGLFDRPLPLRIVASFPTWDWFGIVLHPRLSFSSLHDIRKARFPLHVSVKEDVTHSTRVFIDQLLAVHGFSLDDILSWGGKLNLTGSPTDPRRMEALERGELDAIFDEALPRWFDPALAHGMRPLELEPETFEALRPLGWKPDIVPTSQFKHLAHDYKAVNYSGWPLYARADLPEALVYDVCKSLVARQHEIPWEESGYSGDVLQVFGDSYATPCDIPLHAGTERFLSEARAHRR